MSIELKPVLRPALSEMDLLALEAWAAERGLPRFRARQLAAALHSRGVQSWDELTDLPAGLRDELRGQYGLRTIEPAIHLKSDSDRAEKVLFRLRDGATVETVLIPSANGRRYTVCVSSQVGCPAGCTFCATGLSGFARNLSAPEIADQVLYFSHALRASGQRVTNVVYMGMGEPFLNPVAVRESVRRLTDPGMFGLGERHITVSTVGIIPQIDRFTEWGGQVNLAISLHAPTDELREQLVPYNKHFPVGEIVEAAQRYFDSTRRRVSFEYVLLKGTNDSLDTAAELATLLRPMGGGAHVNLIPWNPFREGRFIRSEGPDADAFAAALLERGVNATIRYSKGLDISAACGQLREQAKAAS